MLARSLTKFSLALANWAFVALHAFSISCRVMFACFGASCCLVFFSTILPGFALVALATPLTATAGVGLP